MTKKDSGMLMIIFGIIILSASILSQLTDIFKNLIQIIHPDSTMADIVYSISYIAILLVFAAGGIFLVRLGYKRYSNS